MPGMRSPFTPIGRDCRGQTYQMRSVGHIINAAIHDSYAIKLLCCKLCVLRLGGRSRSAIRPVCCGCDIQLHSTIFFLARLDNLSTVSLSLEPHFCKKRVSFPPAARPSSAVKYKYPCQILRPSLSSTSWNIPRPILTSKLLQIGPEAPRRFGCAACWPMALYSALVVGMERTLKSGGRVDLCLTAEEKIAS